MAGASEGEEVFPGCLRRNYLTAQILKWTNPLLQVQPTRRTPRNANDCSGKKGQSHKSERKMKRHSGHLVGLSRGRVMEPCTKFTHEPCVHTVLFTSNYIVTLEAVGRHLRLSATLLLLYKCWKIIFYFIWTRRLLLFALAFGASLISSQLMKGSFALNTEIRCTSLGAFRAFGALGASQVKDHLLIERQSSLSTSSKREKMPWKKKNCCRHPVHPTFILELKFSVSAWCQTVTVTTETVSLLLFLILCLLLLLPSLPTTPILPPQA